MPKIQMANPDTQDSVVRPIVYKIIQELFELTGIDARTRIFFYGDAEQGYQLDSTLSGKGMKVTTPYESQVRVEVEDNAIAEHTLATATYRPEHPFVFNDPVLSVSMKPVYSYNELEIQFNFRAKDRATAVRWRNAAKGKISAGRMENLHQIDYHYSFPDTFYLILEQIHTMREAVDGYGESFPDYFSSRSAPSMTVLTNLNGKATTIAYKERQARVLGWFDFEAEPEKGNKESETEAWNISFSYKIRYQKPIEGIMQYPLMVHNQLIPDKFRPNEEIYDDNRREMHFSLSTGALFQFETGRFIHALPNRQGVALPRFDEFLPASVPKTSIRLFTALVSVDPDNPLPLLNLNDLGDYAVNDHILNFLRVEYSYVTRNMESVFCVNLYRDEHSLAKKYVVMDDTLTVSSTEPLPLRSQYHIRLGLVTDWTLLPLDAIRRIFDYPDTLRVIWPIVFPGRSFDFEGRIPLWLIQKWIEESSRNGNGINGRTPGSKRPKLPSNPGGNIQYNTVMTFEIIARKKP